MCVCVCVRERERLKLSRRNRRKRRECSFGKDDAVNVVGVSVGNEFPNLVWLKCLQICFVVNFSVCIFFFFLSFSFNFLFVGFPWIRLPTWKQMPTRKSGE